MEKEKTKISIAVPVYNADVYLKRTINALANQTLCDIQIVLIDDGSVDSSSHICDYYAEQDNRIICVHMPNKGVCEARNTGIRIACGQYMMFCDADDVPDAHQAEYLYNKAISEKADVVLCGFTRQLDGKDIQEFFPYKTSLSRKKDIIDKLVMPMCVWGYPPNTSIYGSVWRGVYESKLLAKEGLLFNKNLRLGEDMAFNAAVWSVCNRIAFIPKPLYYYYENAGSATHSQPELMWNKYLTTWQAVHSILIESGCSDRQLKWHNYQLSRYAINAIVEGVCPQRRTTKEKQNTIKKILSNPDLSTVINVLPTDLSRQKKLIMKFLKPRFAGLILFHYQRKNKTHGKETR